MANFILSDFKKPVDIEREVVMQIQPISFFGVTNRFKTNNTRTFLKPLPCDSVSFSGKTQNAQKTVIIMLGAPNSGKGTYSSMVSQKYGIPQISTGDILRKEVKAQTELGKQAKAYMDSGALVPDELILDIFQNRIAQDDCQKGFILDGFPRNVEQARKLNEILEKEPNMTLKVINLDVDEDILYKRSALRYYCPDCSKTQPVLDYNPEISKCECGGKLVKRSDDTPAVLKNRLDVYRQQSMPLIDFYSDKVANLPVHDDSMPIEECFKQVCGLIDA